MPINKKYIPSPLWPQLGDDFADVVEPAPFPKGILRYRNEEWAASMGLGDLTSREWQEAFWAFKPLPNNLPQPLALRYHGHQFTHYNPDLGDGRGFLYAQLVEAKTNRVLDLATKGSGQTPWSRRGDGRLTLKGAVREALATAFLEALGVNTSKTFSVFETGEPLERGDEPSPTRSAVLTRLSHSHVRIGTFQRLAFLKDKENMQRLVTYALKNYYPGLAAESERAASVLFEAVARETAKTTAQWMLAGFVHGVLNTDNINITGESFDYGPYRFLPHYDTAFVAAYFDHSGLYAYGRQPYVMMWNLEQFLEALSLLNPNQEEIQKGFTTFQDTFSKSTFEFFLKRLNVESTEDARIEPLFTSTIAFLEASKVPFEGFFFDWHGGLMSEERALAGTRASFYSGSVFDNFKKALVGFYPQSEQRLHDAYFQGGEPCHLVIDEIERIWAAIETADNWAPFEEKIVAIQNLKYLLNS